MAYTTIKKPSDYFNTKLYTGNGATLNVTGVGFQPDLVWQKSRSLAYNHNLYDVIRGANAHLRSNLTTAEASPSDGLTSFNSDGYTMVQGGAVEASNNGATYATWNWLANGTGVANTDGTISSTVSANTTSGFSIVKFTASGSGDETVGHGLGVKPKMVITKGLDATSPWNTYNENLNSSAPEDYYIALNSTSASASDSPGVFGAGMTSSTIGVGVGVGFTSGQDYIAYCFADVQGFSKFGSYVGNSSTDGAFVYTGFKPAFLLIKNASADQSWWMWDNKRIGYNGGGNHRFRTNGSDAEFADSTSKVDLLSNGFKWRDGDNAYNFSGNNFIYMAFASEPLVGDNPATAR